MPISELKKNYCRWYKVLLKTLYLALQIPYAICKLLYLFASSHCRDQVRKTWNLFKPLEFTTCFLKLLLMMHICFVVVCWCICKWDLQMESEKEEGWSILGLLSILEGQERRNKSEVYMKCSIFSALGIFKQISKKTNLYLYIYRINKMAVLFYIIRTGS